MSGSWAFGKHVVVMIVATALLGLALISLSATAQAAPYPPTEPCSVTATARGEAAEDGTRSYDVAGSGLGAEQPVRVVQATTGQQVGAAETDVNGAFRTVVTAPLDADATTPDLTATSPQQTCTWTPPPGGPTTSTPATPGTSTPPAPGSGGTGGSGSTGSASTGPGSAGSGNGAGPGSSSGAGAGTSAGGGTGNDGGAGGTGGQGDAPSGAGSSPGGASSGSSSQPGAGTGSAPSATTPGTGSPRISTPPLAEPLPGSDTPFGIGLGIAAVLLVLGTLAVLLLTRRSER